MLSWPSSFSVFFELSDRPTYPQATTRARLTVGLEARAPGRDQSRAGLTALRRPDGEGRGLEAHELDGHGPGTAHGRPWTGSTARVGPIQVPQVARTSAVQTNNLLRIHELSVIVLVGVEGVFRLIPAIRAVSRTLLSGIYSLAEVAGNSLASQDRD